jgi:hypothetical protein
MLRMTRETTGSTHGGKEECMQDFGGKEKKKETTRKKQTLVRG